VPAGPLGRWLGKPTIVKVAMAQSDINFPRQGRLWGRVNRWGVGQFSRYIATSGDIEREFGERGLDTSRVLRIPNGVDTGLFRPVEGTEERDRLKRELGLPPGPLVAFVGMLIPRKNVHVLLEAFVRVRASNPEAHLVIVGPPPPPGSTSRYPEQLNEIVRGANASAGVTFAGRVPSSAPYLRAADVFAFPSAQEGMPNVLLEAMACGIPSIASRISGTTDIVRDGDDGFLFEPTDVDALARRLDELLADSARRRTIGEAARRRVLGSYSLDAVAVRYIALYDELLRGTA
jgi:glycosyltransferase involved in cell wall biosynthesis